MYLVGAKSIGDDSSIPLRGNFQRSPPIYAYNVKALFRWQVYFPRASRVARHARLPSATPYYSVPRYRVFFTSELFANDSFHYRSQVSTHTSARIPRRSSSRIADVIARTRLQRLAGSWIHPSQ